MTAENVFTRECPANISDDVASYWHGKLPPIEQLLQPVPADQRVLRLNFECQETTFDAWAVLVLPTGTVVARTDPPAPDPHQAVDVVADRLAAEIRRHKELIRHDDVDRRKRRRERDSAAVEPRLNAFHQKGQQKEFVELLRAHLRHLVDHARRELIVAQLEGVIRPGQMTVWDLLDEVSVRAWDEWQERPRTQPLDRWLVRVLHEYLDDLNPTAAPPAGKPAAIPANDPGFSAKDGNAPPSSQARQDAQEEQWATGNNPYWPFVDPLARDESLPAASSVAAWQALADDEMFRRVLDEIRKFPRDQRRAFTLHALDGWTIDDIAKFQNRPPDQIRADIDAVRNALRDRLRQPATAQANA